MTEIRPHVKTMDIVRKHNVSAQKKFGQNFLTDPSILEGIVRAAEITKEDCVLEIGPGLGSMTQYLAEAAAKVIAIEIDKALIPVLEDTLRGYDNVTIIQGDVLKLDLAEILASQAEGRAVKVVANLPYYITTPIVMGLLESKLPLTSITIMVQKEVADRIKEGPGSKEYGALSLAVQYYSEPEIMMQVPAECFFPRPNVDSTVIRLTIYEETPVKTKDPELFFAIIRASFNQRRKTLVNGLGSAANLGVTKEKVREALEKMGLSETVRGETLSKEQFAALADLLTNRD